MHQNVMYIVVNIPAQSESLHSPRRPATAPAPPRPPPPAPAPPQPPPCLSRPRPRPSIMQCHWCPCRWSDRPTTARSRAPTSRTPT